LGYRVKTLITATDQLRAASGEGVPDAVGGQPDRQARRSGEAGGRPQAPEPYLPILAGVTRALVKSVSNAVGIGASGPCEIGSR